MAVSIMVHKFQYDQRTGSRTDLHYGAETIYESENANVVAGIIEAVKMAKEDGVDFNKTMIIVEVDE